jgi:hypothetical protein
LEHLQEPLYMDMVAVASGVGACVDDVANGDVPATIDPSQKPAMSSLVTVGM